MSDPAPSLGNEIIFASAGSGKTYALTNRYIRLMALGTAPERIIALTFTRKAAGEFFDAILGKLAGAATSPARAAALAADLALPSLGPADFLAHLRVLVSALHRLNLGTLDSFFASILRNFPFEFGLSGGFEILDDHGADRARAAVYERVFRRDPRRKREQADFLESFRLATFGSEESSLMREFQAFVDDYHRHFLEAPRAAQWGNPDAIWPLGSPWVSRPSESTESLLDALFARFESDPLTDRQRARWSEFRDALARHQPGLPLRRPLEYLLEKLLPLVPSLADGFAEIAYDRGHQSLDAAECDLVLKILRNVIGDDLRLRLRRTRGIWSVLDRYESAYRDLVRRRGSLTFADILVVLAGGDRSSRSAPVLTQIDADERHARRLHIEYRLDARYDHWLLDEFQDTSRPQWRVIANLIDEAAQDLSGTRSLFQVGDLKQAIYAWRGGDARLFQEIRETYRDRVTERPLNDSWRSAPPVIALINDVFHPVPYLDDLLPDDVCQRWEWFDHVSRHPDRAGHAAFLRPAPDGGDDGESKDARRFAIVAEILRDLRPAERGLTCGILVQSRKAGDAVVDYLRARLPDVPVQSEADAAVASDNPLAAAVLALFQFVAHPSDTFALQHLRMTPLEPETSVARTTRLRADLHARGFEAATRTLLDRLAARGHTLDAFSASRAQSLCAAAQAFDLGGDKGIDAFIAFARAHLAAEPAARGVVQVMTIHKSKGLGFDAVILPDLGGNALTQVRDRSLAVHRDASHEIDWILALPPALLANVDPVLAAHLRAQESEACYEQLCKFYVALTRAKRGLYLVLDRPPKSSTSKNFPMLLDRTLGGGEEEEIMLGGLPVDQVRAYGSRDWLDAFPPRSPDTTPPAPPVPAIPRLDPASLAPRHRRRSPSSETPRALGATQIFARAASHGRNFGTAVHALLETVEWLDAPPDEDALRARWKPLQAPEDAIAEVLACLRAPALRGIFASGPDRCWRERRFEIVLDGEWLSGAFDRVLFFPGSARIIDFKTDRIPGPGSYGSQLATYRKALARLTGLNPKAIACELVFTATAEAVLLPAAD